MRLVALVGLLLIAFPRSGFAGVSAAFPPEPLLFTATLDGTIDPMGDTFGASMAKLDIARFNAIVSETFVTFVVDFYNPVSSPSAFAANSAVGFIDLDLDQDSLTGGQAKKSEFSPVGESRLGAELHIDLFSERFHPGQVEIVDWRSVLPVGMASVTYDAASFSVEVPLDLLRGDSSFNYGIIIGDYLDMSDEAPNDDFQSTVPEPSSALLGVTLLLSGAAWRRCRV